MEEYLKYGFKEKPLIGWSILGVLAWIIFNFTLGVLVSSVGLYLAIQKSTKKKLKESPTRTCPQCKLEISSLAKKCVHCHSKVPSEVSPAFIVITIASVVILISTMFNSEPVIHNTNTLPTQQIAIEQVFDVPSLVGKSLNELRNILGTPSYDTEPNATYVQLSEIRTWDKSWSKGGYTLSVTYDIDTKRVIDLFLGTGSDAAFTTFSNKENILKTGNLSLNSDIYSLEFVRVKAVLGKPLSETPEGYTGVIIRKK